MAAVLTIAAAEPRIASAETVLRIGMTAADIPRTLGQPDQAQGNRFTGLAMYDALTMWELSSAGSRVMIPGLATEWGVADLWTLNWSILLTCAGNSHEANAPMIFAQGDQN